MLLCQVLLLHEKVGKPSCFQIQSKRNHSPVSFRTAYMSTEKPIEVPLAHAFLGNRLLTLASSAMRNGLVVTPHFSMATYIDLHASCISGTYAHCTLEEPIVPGTGFNGEVSSTRHIGSLHVVSPISAWGGCLARGSCAPQSQGRRATSWPHLRGPRRLRLLFCLRLVCWCCSRALTAASLFSFPFQGMLTPTEYALAKCYLPYENTVLATYCVAIGFLVVLMLAHFKLLASPLLFGWNLLRKLKTT